MADLKELQSMQNYLTAIWRNFERLKEYEEKAEFNDKWETIDKYSHLQTQVNSLISMYKFRIGRADD